MGRTHQSHNIPWQVLAEIYELQPEYWKLPGGGKTGGTRLKLRRDWDADQIYKAMRHFAQKMAKAVEEFATTVYQKRCNANYACKKFVGSDVLLYNYKGGSEQLDVAERVNEHHKVNMRQQLGHLIEHETPDDYCFGPCSRQSALLTRSLAMDYWRFLYNDYLRPYILMNLATAIDPAWLTKRPVETWLQEVRPDRIPDQIRQHTTLCHQRFFYYNGEVYDHNVKFGALEPERPSYIYGALYRRMHRYDNVKSGQDLEAGLPNYLSMLFRCLYRYHLLMMHCGRRVNWELITLFALPCSRDIPRIEIWPDLDSVLEPFSQSASTQKI